MPPESFLYAIPYQLYVRHRVRRYGFHGTSHRYVAYRYRQLTGRSGEETRHHHPAPRQRLLGLRHPRRRLARDLDGPHPRSKAW